MLAANSVIASAKRLVEARHCLAHQQQHRRNQRAGVADADPPDVIGDREAPDDRGVDAPDADAAPNSQNDGEYKARR